MKTRILKDSAAIFCIGLSVLAASSCGSNPFRKSTPVKAPVKVRVADVRTGNSRSEKTYIARTEASKSVTVTSPFPATLQSLKVSQGSRVKAGQTIATVHSESVQNTLSATQATLRQAQDAYDRISSVKDNGSIAPLKVIEVETALEKAKSAYRMAQKSLSDCSVKAPYTGTVSEVFVDEGVDLGIAQPIVRIADLDNIEVIISVPESEIARMTVGREATLSVPALDDAAVTVRIVRRGVAASPVSHTYECALAPSARITGLMPGMVGKVVFREDGAVGKREIVIPSSAVKTDVDGRYVWTVDEDSFVRKVNVTVGGFAGKGVVITGGLSEGDRLIIDGCSKVSTGMKVEAVY